MPSPFTYPQKPPYKTAHKRPKTKAFWRKTASSLKGSSHYLRLNKANCDIQIWRSFLKSSSPQSFSKHGKNELAGASGDIKFNELNRARANALG
ncbi:MAG: hypothetical protein ACFNTA_01165 [Campylobacter sp.]|uniref:hypothetical protein n=1 Tax=Campylobacter sp. TaxID=205 RepID=UPI0036100D46